MDETPEDYGIRLADRFGMPSNVVETAKAMREQLAEFAKVHPGVERYDAALEVFKVLNAIRKKTRGNLQETKLLLDQLREKLLG